MRRTSLILVFAFACIVSASAQELLIFGGSSHDKFLGCLTCSKYNSGSIFNRYGTNGSKYSEASIWNKYGDYGSKYSEYSPWNKYALHPPVIVDRDGNFYGYFTANKYHEKRTAVSQALRLLEAYEQFDEELSDLFEALHE